MSDVRIIKGKIKIGHNLHCLHAPKKVVVRRYSLLCFYIWSNLFKLNIVWIKIFILVIGALLCVLHSIGPSFKKLLLMHEIVHLIIILVIVIDSHSSVQVVSPHVVGLREVILVDIDLMLLVPHQCKMLPKFECDYGFYMLFLYHITVLFYHAQFCIHLINFLVN